MKLTSEERLKFLARQVTMAEARLNFLEREESHYQGQRDYPAMLERAQEALATAEALLLLTAERDLLWRNALEAISPEDVATPAPAPPTPAAEKS